MLDETVGERIARLRERRGWTQFQLAELASTPELDVTESWVAAAEKDRIKNPLKDRRRIIAIARVLEVSHEYLTAPLKIKLLDDDAPPPKPSLARLLDEDGRWDRSPRIREALRSLIQEEEARWAEDDERLVAEDSPPKQERRVRTG